MLPISMDGDAFRAYEVTPCLCELAPGDIVVMDNLRPTRISTGIVLDISVFDLQQSLPTAKVHTT